MTAQRYCGADCYSGDALLRSADSEELQKCLEKVSEGAVIRCNFRFLAFWA